MDNNYDSGNLSHDSGSVSQPNSDMESSQESAPQVLLMQKQVEYIREDRPSPCSSDFDSDKDGVNPSDEPEKSSDEPEKPYEPPSDELKQKIMTQVEFYFQDSNITKDTFLLKHVRRNRQGFVSLKLIASFRKVKSLTKDYRDVIHALRESTQLEVNPEGTKVRRLKPVPDADETSASRTVIAFNLPMAEPSVVNVSPIFSACGQVSLVRILRPGNTIPNDVRKFLSKHPELENNVCAVIEFEKHENAVKAVKDLTDGDNWRSGLAVTMLAPVGKKKKDSNGPDTIQDVGGSGDAGKSDGRGGRSFSPGQYWPRLSPSPGSSPQSSPYSSPRSSPMASPNVGRRRVSHGKSPLAVESYSPETHHRTGGRGGARGTDDAFGGRGGARGTDDVLGLRGGARGTDDRSHSPGSPWIQRRLAAAAAAAASQTEAVTGPGNSPRVGRKVDNDRLLRLPRGPDGTPGFIVGRARTKENGATPPAVPTAVLTA